MIHAFSPCPAAIRLAAKQLSLACFTPLVSFLRATMHLSTLPRRQRRNEDLSVWKSREKERKRGKGTPFRSAGGWRGRGGGGGGGRCQKFVTRIRTKTRPDVRIFWRAFNRIVHRRLSRDCRHERPIGFARITRPRLVELEWLSLPLSRVGKCVSRWKEWNTEREREREKALSNWNKKLERTMIGRTSEE